MIARLLDHRISVRQILYLVIALGVPYLTIGVVWAITHHDHLADVHGVDKVFSLIGEVIAWPPLVISDISLR